MDIIQVISTLGFPIASCVAMAFYVKYITDKNREDMENMRKEHKEEMSNVTTALNNNTLAIQKLTDFIIKKED